MATLNKVSRLTIRLTPEMHKRIRAAAAISSRKKGERIDPSALVRELVMPVVDGIIAEAGDRADDDTEDDVVGLAA